MALDAAGFVCPPADLVNAIISLARGKWVDAGIDFVAAVPWRGDQIKASHMAEKAGKKAIQGLEFTYKAAGNAVDAVDTLKSGLKGTLDTLDSMMGAQREFAVVGGLTMLVDDFWDAGKTLDRLDDTADLVKNARNYADGIDNFRDGSKIVNNLGDTAKAGSNAADAGKAVENTTDGLKGVDQAKYLDDGLDMAAGGDSKYIYRGKDVSPDLEVKVNVVDEAGNVVDTYSNAAKNIEGPGEVISPAEAADKIVNGERIGTASRKLDPGHRSASFLTEAELSQGQTFINKGYDGIERTLLQVEGELNGSNGIFEYIITPEGQISHQRFIKGGIINGAPNQTVPKGGY